MRNERRHPGRDERGSALVFAIFVLVLLGAMGITLLFLTQSELKMNQAQQRYGKAFYLAEGGLEDGRLHLRQDLADMNAGLTAAAGPNGVLDFDPGTVRVNYNGAGMPMSLGGFGDDVPLIGLTRVDYGESRGWYAVFLNNDLAEGKSTAVDGNNTVLMTAIGVGQDNASEIVQAVIEPVPLMPDPPEAAISLLGPSPVFNDGNNLLKRFDGDDCGGSGIPGHFGPAVGVIGTATTTTVRLGIGASTYVAGGLPPTLTVADLSDTTEAAVSRPITTDWTSCSSVRSTIEKIRLLADVVCTSPSCVLPPSAPDRIIFADTDFDLPAGSGLAVVTGELQISAAGDWAGVLLVVGEGTFIRSGAGQVSGAIVVANIAGPDGVYGNADDCTGGTDGFSTAKLSALGTVRQTFAYCDSHIRSAIPEGAYAIQQFAQR